MKLSHHCHRPLILLRDSCSKAMFGGLVLLSSTFAWADLTRAFATQGNRPSGSLWWSPM